MNMAHDPVDFDGWLQSLLPQSQQDREYLAQQAARLLDDPAMKRIFLVLEARALRDVSRCTDPEKVPEMFRMLKLVQGLRRGLEVLLEDDLKQGRAT